MSNEITFELLFDRIKALESTVEDLKREVRILRRQNNTSNISNLDNDRLSKLRLETISIINYLDTLNITEEGPVKVPFKSILENTNIDIDDPQLFIRRFGTKVRARSRYDLLSPTRNPNTNEPLIEIGVRKVIGIKEITDYIKDKIENSEEDVIEINAREIHKDLRLIARMPTVCKAMEKLMDSKLDKEKGVRLSSTFTVYYKTGKRNW